jgi:hypothetical protein
MFTSGILLSLIFIAIASIPIFLLFVIFHFKRFRHDEIIQNPVMKGFFYGLVVSISLLFYIYHDATGEGGLALIAYSPFLLISSLIPGLLIGFIFNSRNKRIEKGIPFYW